MRQSLAGRKNIIVGLNSHEGYHRLKGKKYLSTFNFCTELLINWNSEKLIFHIYFKEKDIFYK